MRTLPLLMTRCAAVLALIAGTAGCASAPQDASVTIMVPWNGNEFKAFYGVIDKFQHDYNVRVDVEVTRAQTQQLDAAVRAKHPPDLAVLPSVGAINHYAASNAIRPLTQVKSSAYLAPFGSLMSVDGKVYAVPVKVDVKSLIWYDPAFSVEPPTTPSRLAQLSKAHAGIWCLGLASGPTSGWPGADWIADLLLAQGGPTAYEDWLTGSAGWSQPPVTEAWNTWGDLIRAGPGNPLAYGFDKAARQLTQRSAGCRLGHGGLAAMGFATALIPGTDYDFAVPSRGSALEVSADFVGMFNDTPYAAALIKYLSGAEAQKLWVGAPGGYALSANKAVALSSYRNSVQREVAALLEPAAGYWLCFSAADTMAPDVSEAFYQAVVNYVNGQENPAAVSRLVQSLGAIQSAARRSDPGSAVARDEICSSPR